MQDDKLIQLEAVQTSQAAKSLARAFHNDPLYVLAMPEENKRTEVLMWLFERVVRYSRLYGEVYTTSAVEGVTCWLPPGGTPLTLGRIVRSGLHVTPLKMGLAAYRCFDAYMSYADKLQEHYAPKPHWYLWVIGVDPSSQGRGIGGRLLDRLPVKAREDGAVCYLETEVEGNVHFYEKHGFKVVGEGEVPKLGLHVWAMLREAASA